MSSRSLLDRWIRLAWSDDRHTRIRLQQWSLAAGIYLVGAGLLLLLSIRNVTSVGSVLAWMAFNWLGLAAIYAAIRSGASLRLADPSLTQAQMLFGVANVIWCYTISTAARGAMLYPLILIFTFGAFSLQWRRIAALTVVALASVGVAMWALHRAMPGVLDPTIDLSNFLSVSIILPGTAAVASTLARLRLKLRAQRAQLEDALSRIQDLASRDALTGLFNRRHAEMALQVEIERSARSGQPFTLALIDLDHFKTINDRYGHGAGDEVLKSFANTGMALIRSIDTLARWGGEEFLLLMPNTTADAAMVVAQRLRGAVARHPLAAGDALITYTLSAGLCEHRPGLGPVELLQQADGALYQAKSAGRNRVSVAPAEGVGPL